MASEPRRQALCFYLRDHHCSGHSNHPQNAANAAPVEHVRLGADLDQRLRDIDLQIGISENEVQFARARGGRTLKTGDAYNAPLLAEEIQRLGRFVGQANGPLRIRTAARAHSLNMPQTSSETNRASLPAESEHA